MSVDPKDLESAFPEYSVDPQPLGTGGFKVAHQVEVDGASFVLKVVKQPIDDPDAALPERLRREIEAMRNVDSPRVVRIERGPEIRELGGEQHVWYLEPFYDGGTLDAKVGSAMRIDEVMTLTLGLLEAVEALWNQGRLVHRDIKPANIAFDEGGLPVLLDLGIALHENLTPITEEFGFSPRTPAYAAPEQFEVRRLASIDFRTDLFLIGVVAFEALTGSHPFSPNQDPGSYANRLFQGGVDTTALDRVDNVDNFKSLLLRLLKPRPNQRFRTLSAARSALEAAR